MLAQGTGGLQLTASVERVSPTKLQEDLKATVG